MKSIIVKSIVKFFETLMIPILLFLILPLSLTFTDARPYWIHKGVYAVYSFKKAYIVKGFGEYGWEFISIGGGYYRWEVLDVNGELAVLNVTVNTGNLAKSINVTINTETMDLIDEEGRVWGKAWLWINLVRLPPSNISLVRNITVVIKWLNESLKDPLVTPIYSSTKNGLVPVKTELGSVDNVVSFAMIRTTLKNYMYDNTTFTIDTSAEGEEKPCGQTLQWDYEAKYGLMIEGLYMDDILSQKFGIPYFEKLPSVIPTEKGSLEREDYPYPYWIRLSDTNLDIEIMGSSDDIFGLLKKYFLQTLFIVLALLFVLAFIRSRRV